MTTLAVSYRLVARSSMLNWTAGEIANLLLTNKTTLKASLSLADGIEVPDVDDKAEALKVHPGVRPLFFGQGDGFRESFQD
jgi:hypothetical protein